MHADYYVQNTHVFWSQVGSYSCIVGLVGGFVDANEYGIETHTIF